MRPSVRLAGPQDAEAIARVHVQAWEESYRGIAPDDVFETLNLERRLGQWRDMLAPENIERRADYPIVLVAEFGGDIVGFVSAGPSKEPLITPKPQVFTLYVLKRAQGLSIGRSLLREIGAHLGFRGFGGFGLGVLPENGQATGFYERMGGRCIGELVGPGPVWRTVERVYIFDDIRTLQST